MPTEFLVFAVDMKRVALSAAFDDADQLSDGAMVPLFLDVPEALQACAYLSIAERVVFTRHW